MERVVLIDPTSALLANTHSRNSRAISISISDLLTTLLDPFGSYDAELGWPRLSLAVWVPRSTAAIALHGLDGIPCVLTELCGLFEMVV
jgi:hypothetical protein